MSTVIRDGKRYHLTSGDYLECGASKLIEDCPICNLEKQKEIDKWLKQCKSICLRCDERPPCYLCLRKKCKDWCADEQYLRERGSFHGCKKLILNKYCSEFFCKYGLRGWWQRNSHKINKIKFKNILKKLHKRKTAEVNAVKMEERRAALEKKKPPKLKAVVARKPVENTAKRSSTPSVGKRHSNLHRRRRISMRRAPS